MCGALLGIVAILCGDGMFGAYRAGTEGRTEGESAWDVRCE